MQGQHAASRTDIEIAGDRGNGSSGDSGIGIGSAERVEMSLRRPDCTKAPAIGVARTVEQQFVFARADGIVVTPEEKTESQFCLFAPFLEPAHSACRFG